MESKSYQKPSSPAQTASAPSHTSEKSLAMLQALASNESAPKQAQIDPIIQVDKKENQKSQKLDSASVHNLQSRILNERIALSRESILSFANQLKEAVRNYKPPFTRLSLELSPKELGTIELVLTQKGRDLQISITSNTQAITLFAQNQNDLRANLQNIGFNQVEMNFSQSGHSGGFGGDFNEANQQKRNKNGLQTYEMMSKLGETSYESMEIILPKYA